MGAEAGKGGRTQGARRRWPRGQPPRVTPEPRLPTAGSPRGGLCPVCLDASAGAGGPAPPGDWVASGQQACGWWRGPPTPRPRSPSALRAGLGQRRGQRPACLPGQRAPARCRAGTRRLRDCAAADPSAHSSSPDGSVSPGTSKGQTKHLKPASWTGLALRPAGSSFMLAAEPSSAPLQDLGSGGARCPAGQSRSRPRAPRRPPCPPRLRPPRPGLHLAGRLHPLLLLLLFFIVE